MHINWLRHEFKISLHTFAGLGLCLLLYIFAFEFAVRRLFVAYLFSCKRVRNKYGGKLVRRPFRVRLQKYVNRPSLPKFGPYF